MPERVARDLRESLERIQDATSTLFDALVSPYEALARTEPTAVLGAPARVPPYVSPATLKPLADKIADAGRDPWSVRQVDSREAQIREFVEDYRHGKYGTMTTADWIATVQKFRDAVNADINTAMQAPRGWDRLDLSRLGNHRGHLDKPLLTPRDVAPELGIGERAVRKKINAGELGPWRKDGSRWIISREAFLHFWESQLGDEDVPRPPGSRGRAREANRRLEHYHLK